MAKKLLCVAAVVLSVVVVLSVAVILAVGGAIRGSTTEVVREGGYCECSDSGDLSLSFAPRVSTTGLIFDRKDLPVYREAADLQGNVRVAVCDRQEDFQGNALVDDEVRLIIQRTDRVGQDLSAFWRQVERIERKNAVKGWLVRMMKEK